MKDNTVIGICLILAVLVCTIGGLAAVYFICEIPEQNNSEKPITDMIEEERLTHESTAYPLFSVIHDNKLNVTCWYRRDSGSISCIPDNQLDRRTCDECNK